MMLNTNTLVSSAERSCNLILVRASRAENGSSISSRERPSINVRSSALRWRMPPDSEEGSVSSKPASRPLTMSSSACRRSESVSSPRNLAPSRTLSRRLNQGSSRSSCPIQATVDDSGGLNSTVPLQVNPVDPEINRSRVDLPQPLGPRMQVV